MLPEIGSEWTRGDGSIVTVTDTYTTSKFNPDEQVVCFRTSEGQEFGMVLEAWNEMLGNRALYPEPRTLWKHKENGELYRVIVVANEHAARDGWVPTVVYERCEDQTVWARPVSEWEGRYVRA